VTKEAHRALELRAWELRHSLPYVKIAQRLEVTYETARALVLAYCKRTGSPQPWPWKCRPPSNWTGWETTMSPPTRKPIDAREAWKLRRRYPLRTVARLLGVSEDTAQDAIDQHCRETGSPAPRKQAARSRHGLGDVSAAEIRRRLRELRGEPEPR
jgi:hypothetical protein